MSTDDALAHARELLPFYVNGTLEAGEQRLVEEQLARSRALRAELEWLRKLDAQLDEGAAAPAGDLGLSRLMARIDAERDGRVVTLPASRRRRWMLPALALAASVLLAQSIVIGVLMQQHDDVLRPLSGHPPQAAGALLQVRFKAEAPEGRLRALLIDAGADIVSGPGALGIYTLRVDPKRVAEAVKRLKSEPDLVESVSVIGK